MKTLLARLMGPPPTTDDRARVYTLFATVMTGGAIVSGLLAIIYGALGFSIHCVRSALMTIVMLLLRRYCNPKNVEVGFFISVVLGLASMAAVAIDFGGLGAPAAVWLIIPPVAGYLLLGRRIALLCALGSILTIVSIAVFANEAPLPPAHTEILRAISGILCIGVTLLIVGTQDRGRNAAFKLVEEANTTLARARDDAEAASKLKSDFVATVSHELKTPLTAIIGMNRLLLDSELTAQQRERAHTAKTAAESLLLLVDDLLDVSRLEAGKIVLAPAPCDISAIAESVRSLLTFRAREKNVDLRLEIPHALPRVIADAPRVRQVLLNLVDNAVKFTQRGSVTIRIHAESAEPGVRIHLVVEDTGIGVAPEMTAAIFGRFRQADSSTTRRYGGTGLGLSIAKDLTALMGGSIWVESTQNVGSTFRVDLDLREAPPDERIAPASLEGTSVLLAEDNIVSEQLTVHMLKSLGCRVEVAHDGNEAVRMASQGHYDVVLMDCHMPIMDGYRAASVIRARLGTSLPILALTASSSADDVRRALDAGMDALLPKPIDLEGMKVSLSRVVGQA